jgi:hypothetical protein
LNRPLHNKWPAPAKSSLSPRENWESLFAGAVGLLLALALLKFGNPVIFEEKIGVPRTREEFLVQPWPFAWGYGLSVLVFLLGLTIWRWETRAPKWILFLPLIWFAWQLLSAFQTVNRVATLAVLKHFFMCTVWVYLGHFALSRVKNLRLFWLGLVGGFLVVMIVGWEQHFGGLQKTRDYFYSLPDWQSYPPEFLKKIASNRIYSTLFYPNVLAGVVILFLPVTLYAVSVWLSPFPTVIRLPVIILVAGLALTCLVWSGSKGGWLIVLAQGIVCFICLPLRRKFKAFLLVSVLAAGIGGFWLQYRAYFERGATSATARLDYWKVAWLTLKSNPFLGTGPGTFMISYQAGKPPQAEMSRLAHNDYLQQACDSGFIGFLSYSTLILVTLISLYRNSIRSLACPTFAIWLGVLGLAIQSLVEFGLYVPALAWPLFLFYGWLWALWSPTNQIDRTSGAH